MLIDDDWLRLMKFISFFFLIQFYSRVCLLVIEFAFDYFQAVDFWLFLVYCGNEVWKKKTNFKENDLVEIEAF